MPDKTVALQNNPKYSVRFANTGIWDSATGYNNLNATVTVTGAVVVEYVVFDDATGDGKWSTAGNWQGGNLPTAEQTARIYKPCTVDITDAVAKAVLVTTGTDGVTTYTGHLTIAPTAGLNVVQKIQKAVDADFAHPEAVTAADLTIQASSAGQGALVLGTEDPETSLRRMTEENY